MNTIRRAGTVIPAVLGMVSAVLLGSAGFGLGCLYADLASPIPVPSLVPSAAPAAATTDPTVVAAMGGPEEPAPPVALPVATRIPFASEPGRALAMGFQRPVAGGWISSSFGRRMDPFTGRPALHRGLDFAGNDNSAILAAAAGIVTWSGRQRGYGNLIEIDHGRGWVTRYGHNTSNLVKVGDYVKPGQTIALMGATGRATGTHLHFEVLYRSRQQNPARFVPQDA
ncbi:MAG: M23 family metallopeptidase [Gammaproteobacteria bacterium]